MADFETLDRRRTASAKWDGAIRKYGRENLLVFSIADSDYKSAPPIIEALKKRVEHGAFGYTMIEKDYLDTIRNYYERRYGVSVKRNWILAAPKVLNALSFLINELTDEKEKVAIQTPVYNMFPPVVKDNGRRLIENALIKEKGRYQMDLKTLEKQFQSGVRILILCNPHNPVGRVWTEAELGALVSLCRRYDVHLISDEIHADIIMDDHRFVSLAHYIESYSKISIVNAPSKTFNIAGIQVSYLIIPDNTLRSALKKTYKALFLSTPNALGMTALKAAYTECDDWLEAQNRHIAANYRYLKDFFDGHIGKDLVTPLEATYLVWVDIRFTGLTSKAFVEGLAQKGAVLASGRDYGVHGEGYVRINIACSTSQLKQGLALIKDYVYALK